MTTSEKLPGTQDDQIDKGFVQAGEGETNNPMPDITREAIMPKMKGLDILKEGIYTVDLEKTINDMFLVIKNMESQLEKALSINSLLEKDLSEAKEVIAGLKEEKSKSESIIERMESEIPSKRELQMENEQLIEERNGAEISIREMKAQVKKMQELVIQHQQKSGELEEEKRDVIAEIDYLESRLQEAAGRITHLNKEINILRGEKLINEEKIKSLESNLQVTLDEKRRLIRDITTSIEAVDDLRYSLSDKKLRAKKAFYQSEDQKTE
jgi:chromosome segregation ATPase